MSGVSAGMLEQLGADGISFFLIAWKLDCNTKCCKVRESMKHIISHSPQRESTLLTPALGLLTSETVRQISVKPKKKNINKNKNPTAKKVYQEGKSSVEVLLKLPYYFLMPYFPKVVTC